MTTDAARRYLVAYDIADDRRRSRIAKQLQEYGDRVQYSVFIVDVRPARLVRLRTLLEYLIDETIDSVLLCDLGPIAGIRDRQFEFLGRAADITPHGTIII